MKSGKAWCLAFGFFLGASLIPAARAQNQQDQQNSPQGSGDDKSQDQNDTASNAKSGQNSNDSNAKQGQNPSGSDKSQQAQNSKDSDSKQRQNPSGADNSQHQDSKDSGSNKTQGQSGADQSNSQKGNGTQGTGSNPANSQQSSSEYQYGVWPSKDQQEQSWRHLLSADGQGWFQGAGSPPELNLAAADDSVRELLNLPKGQGVVVLWVAPNSGAAQAGIQENDVLLLLGESPLGKPNDLYDRLKQAGEKSVPLTLLRSGSRVTLHVQPLVRVTLRPVQATAPAREYWIGISVTPLEPVLRAQLRLSQNHGVIVHEVYPDCPAAKAGIALHDIITALDGRPISDPNDLAKSVQAKGEKPLVVEVIGKGGKPRTVSVTPERKKTTETSQVARFPFPVNSVAYDFVRPGVVLEYANPILDSNQPARVHLGEAFANYPLQMNPALSQKPRDGNPALTKRLDALDSDLKELRKLVEALQKAATTIIERQKSTAESSTKE